jgi:hypothetical protein
MNKQTIWIVAIIATILLIIVIMRKSIKNIIANFKIRGTDAFGSGAYGAARKKSNGTEYKHQGLDIVAESGATVKAPFDLTFVRKAYPYSGDTNYTGAVYNFDEGEIRIYYITPIITEKNFKQGEVIGTAQNISAKYSTSTQKLTNHIHIEIRDKKGNLIDPNTYV